MPSLIRKWSQVAPRIALVVAGLGASSCQKGSGSDWLQDVAGKEARPKEQQQGQVIMPAAGDAGYPLALSGNEQFATRYRGNLIIWDPNVVPGQVAAIARASADGRLRKSAYLDFVRDTVEPARQAVLSKSEKLAAHIQAMDDDFAHADPLRLRQSAEEIVKKWFPERLAELAQKHPELSALTGEATTQLESYCEYRLFNFAVHPLLNLRFSHRPTPAMICESYYEKQGYFRASDGSVPAACDSDQNGGDFFACMWRHGVLASRLVSSLARVPAATCAADAGLVPAKSRYEALHEWLYGTYSDGAGSVAKIDVLRKALSDRTKFLGSDVRSRMWNAMARGMPFSLAHRSVDPRYKAIFHTCKNAFHADVLPSEPSGDLSWSKKRSIDEYKIVVENKGFHSSIPSADTFLLPSAVAEPQTYGAFYDELNQRLIWPLAAYLDRENAKTMLRFKDDEHWENPELARSIKVSPDDGWFNHPLDDVIMPLGDQAALAELVHLKDVYVKAEDRAKRQELEAELRVLQDAFEQKEAERSILETAVGETTTASAAAATNPGAAHFVRDFELELTIREGLLALKFAVSGGVSHHACFDFTEIVACPKALASTQKDVHRVAAMVYDPETMKLGFDLEVDDPEAQGFSHRPRLAPDKTDFNDLATSSFEGRVLRFEVYPNQLGGYLRFVTGKAFLIRPDGENVAEGSFSADNYTL